MRFGIILVIFGLLALLNNTGLLNDQTMSIVWPVSFVVIGVWLILRKGCCWKRGFMGAKMCDCHNDCDHKNSVCSVDPKSSK